MPFSAVVVAMKTTDAVREGFFMSSKRYAN